MGLARCLPLAWLLLALGCGGGHPESKPTTGYGTPVPGLNLALGRIRHTATLLQDGRVLVAGGTASTGTDHPFTATAEVVDAMRNEVTATAPMAQARDQHSATRLLDGRVLIAGGMGSAVSGELSLKSAEIFDPATGRFSATGSMGYARRSHAATLLLDGRVLITGGDGPIPDWAWPTAELYDPATGRFQNLPSMSTSRTLHSATRLDSGQVLIAGGTDWFGGPAISAEIFDPATLSFRRLSYLFLSIGSYAGKLPSGRLLFAGGNDGLLYDQTSESFSTTGGPNIWRGYFSSVDSQARLISILGGLGEDFIVLNSIETYDESYGRFQEKGILSKARWLHTSTLLPDGRVLVEGGTTSGALYVNECEVLKLD